ncbi:MAG TPA: RHS repeat-associated core domain-containing protein, partial [Opitutaceae bacterium]|nr:RHS repeat-associated core domain-containing protein [Opitutaceae bacterium]HPK50391.1 RHS repeat-associated core domain-containing protein [Opitutaceae bacterium]
MPAGFYGANRTIQATYADDKPWQQTGIQLKNGSAIESETLATFDPSTGRVTVLAGSGASFGLAYKANTDWVESLTAGSYVQTRTLLSNRDALERLRTTWAGAAKGDYSGTFDSSGRRASQVLGGETGNGSTNTYTYDARGQLISSTNSAATTRSFAWAFDQAGNRTTQTHNGAVTTYGTGAAGGSANSLNQHPSISGAQAESGLQHDADGNMTADGSWTCSYDAENRLTQMVRKNGTQTLQFAYDYLGRRVRKTVRSGGPTAAITASTKFVWSGWKLIAELNAGTAQTGASLAKTYLWGPDISGGAGAAGLLAVRQGGLIYYPVYDLHGNVTGYLDASGSVAARYEYNATGQVIASSGNASSFAFGHSTQFTDPETGWVYFGLRFYNPKHGRFINRDPIHEQGGLNLYAYCANTGLNAWDILGMRCWEVSWVTSVYDPKMAKEFSETYYETFVVTSHVTCDSDSSDPDTGQATQTQGQSNSDNLNTTARTAGETSQRGHSPAPNNPADKKDHPKDPRKTECDQARALAKGVEQNINDGALKDGRARSRMGVNDQP